MRKTPSVSPPSSREATKTGRAWMRRRDDCRLCASRDLTRLFSLGETPLANEFVRAEEVGHPQDRFPLEVYFCTACGHVQLLDIVDPARLFCNYVYVSGTSPVFVDHFRSYAQAVLEMTGMPPGSRVVEIGSNDGTLLYFFKEAGMQVHGIDPARAIAQEATDNGIPTIPEFFDLELAHRLRREGWEADLVCANNVFAHVDDLHTIVDGIAHLLKPDGLFVFEVSYLVDVFEKTLFDTIYHEHLSYHAVKPLVGLFERHGMELIDVIRIDSHGGSLRGIAQMKGAKWPRQSRVDELIVLEESRGLYDVTTYEQFLGQIQQRKAQLTELLRRLNAQGKTVVGFGAPAKATTLMFYFGIGPETLGYIIDDSPWKQGLYSPGHHIPIVPASHLYDEKHRSDYALILAWNFADTIIQRHKPFLDAGGHFIVPLPRLEIR